MSEQLAIDGFDDLDRQLDKLADELHNTILKESLEAGAEPIAQRARELCPVYQGRPRAEIVPGALLASITVRKARISRGEVSVKVRATAINPKDHEGYAGVLEYRPVPASRLFMRPAHDQQKQAAEAAIVQTLRAGIERTAGT